MSDMFVCYANKASIILINSFPETLDGKPCFLFMTVVIAKNINYFKWPKLLTGVYLNLECA